MQQQVDLGVFKEGFPKKFHAKRIKRHTYNIFVQIGSYWFTLAQDGQIGSDCHRMNRLAQISNHPLIKLNFVEEI